MAEVEQLRAEVIALRGELAAAHLVAGSQSSTTAGLRSMLREARAVPGGWLG